MSPTYLTPIKIKDRPILGPRPTCGSYAFQFTGYNIQTYFITLKKLNRPKYIKLPNRPSGYVIRRKSYLLIKLR